MDTAPSEFGTSRMQPLARLPAFFALGGKRCVVAGCGTAAAWKAELLAAAGARVDAFASEPTEALRALAAAPPAGAVFVHRRPWTPADITGAAIAIAECAEEAEAARFAAAARTAGVPVNVIDRPAFCDFAFGAIVNRSPLVIGISTDGAAPVFGQAMRTKIEVLIPFGFARWADAAREWRPRLQALALSFRGRRQFWERFAERAMAAPDRAPTEGDFDALRAPSSAVATGSVVLVDAGIGDPELLTLRAVRALQSADVIVFDQLVSAEILDFARREAKKMLVSQTRSDTSDDIDALTVSLARAGRRVVRLGGGAAAANVHPENAAAAACRAAGIAVEIVPAVRLAQSGLQPAAATGCGTLPGPPIYDTHGHDDRISAGR